MKLRTLTTLFGKGASGPEKTCPCCGGHGEHGSGFECYLCDAAGTVPADTADDAPCDGRYNDGGPSHSFGAFGPEGIMCAYPHPTGRRTAGEYHEPEMRFEDRKTPMTWTQARQYGAEDRMALHLPEHPVSSVEHAQQIADKVTKKAGVRPVVVQHTPERDYSFAQIHPEHGTPRIVLGKGGMNHGTLLHELAHHIDREKGTQDDEEPHGDNFRDHFEHALVDHHPNSYVAREAFRDRFQQTDQLMRMGGQARYSGANPEMNEREKAQPPVPAHKPMWEHNPETLRKAQNAVQYRSEPHTYRKSMHDYPELDYDSDEDYERSDAHMADEDLEKGMHPRLVPPHMLDAWVKHHPDPGALEDPEYDDDDKEISVRKHAAEDPDDPGLIHRGLSVVLPEHIHKFVHDESQPAGARAHMLLAHVRKERPEITSEEAKGTTGGLGNYWSPSKEKAAEYGDQGGWKAYHDHERGHDCGDSETGYGGCPSTHVVLHAGTPLEKHHWTENFRDGEKYDPEVSWRLPVRPDAKLMVHGVSWKQGHDSESGTHRDVSAEKAEPYSRYDFLRPMRKRAVLDPAARPHQAATAMAQKVLREQHPEVGNPLPYSEQKASQRLQDVLEAHGHPGAASAFVERHEDPARSSSSVAYDADTGDVGVSLHKRRYDYGTLAHEAGHLLDIHRNGRDMSQAGQPDDVVHGDGFRQGYHDALHHMFGEDAASTFTRNYRKHLRLMKDDPSRYKVSTVTKRASVADDPGPSRTMQPEEYGSLHFPDHPGLNLDQVAKRLRQSAPAYYDALKSHIAEHGIQAPVLLDGKNVMDGHHRLAIAHELGMAAPLGDYNNPDHYNQAMDHPSGKEWYRKRTEMGARRTASADGGPVPDGTQGKDSWGHEVEMTPQDGWAHLDGSHGEDDPHAGSVGDRPVYTQTHTWLPEGKYWGPNSAQNDQRLFNGDHLRPEVRQDILDRVGGVLGKYGDWQKWTRVYFAGSQAAQWLDQNGQGNGDFDILIGIDFEEFRDHDPQCEEMEDAEIATALTDELWAMANVKDYFFTLADGRSVGPFDRTFFVNPRAWDIKNLRPYAAYNVTSDDWAVHPLQVPKDWNATHLPESYWGYAEALLHEIQAIGQLPAEERHRMAANLWEELHTHRSDAFGDGGHGLFDLSNIIEKYLDQHPDKPWAQLVQWKNESPSGPTSWVPTTARRTTLTTLFDSKLSGLDFKTAAEGADTGGMMIAIVPPKKIRQDIAVEDGEPVEAMHVTLAYMGSAKEYTAKQRRDLHGLVEGWARTQKALTARIGGAGTFVNPGQHVLWAAVDIPHGGAFRQSLVDVLETHGYDVRNDHGWTPHITLDYRDHHVRFLPKVEPASWDITEIHVCVGGHWEAVTLG